MRRALIRLGAVLALILIVFLAWQFSPLREWSDPDRLGSALNLLSANPWAGPIVVAAFLLGSFIVFPVTAMIAATGIALGPTAGLLWATVGSLAAAVVNYWLARMLPEKTLDETIGGWIRKLGRRFERGGIVSIMVARNIPIAPFTLINVVAGAANIPFRDYVIGTLLGLGPTLAALTVLGDRLRGAWEAPTALNIGLVILAVIAWFVLALSLQSLSNRWVSRMSRV